MKSLKPKRFLFSTNTGYGHFHPLVPLAQALQQAGHEVAFAVSPVLQKAVETAGFSFFPVKTNLAADPEYQQLKLQLQTMPLNLDYELFAYPRLFGRAASRLRIPTLIEIARTWQADMLIREAGEYAASIAADYLGLPHATVAFATSLKGHAIFERELATQLDPLRREWGLNPDPALSSLYRYLQLSYSPPTFSLGEVEWSTKVAEVPATTHFIQPQFFDQATDQSLPAWIAHLPARPTVYLTLGTEVNGEPQLYPGVLQTIIAGLQDSQVNLIVTLGRDKDPADFGPQPDHIHIERYLPQSLLLPHCDLMIMHGGSNTLLAALDLGLPFVVVPLIADQFFNAELVQKLGLGQVVSLAQLTPLSIRTALEEVINNPGYREKARQMQAEMKSLPDQSYALELIEQVVTLHQPILNPQLTTT